MNNLVLKEKQEFMGIEIPVIEGGFGEGQKVILVKTVAEIHEQPLKKINELINNNIDEFEQGIDILDLKKNKNFAALAKDSGLYTQNSINASSNIYLLSEQGYMALVGLMRTDKAKEIRRKLRREYFAMKAELETGQAKQIKPNLKEKEIQTRFNNSLARKANALLKIANDPLTTKERKKALLAQATEILTGSQEIKTLPQPIKKTYSATEIGKKLGISSNKVGRLANTHNLKTPEFGMFFKQTLEKNDKEVEEFKYYEDVVPVLKELLNVQVKLDI
ncbi:ORF6N domain-containing protein [Clostridium perfringens]|uniref:ORF6N domain-containing protein n=1 Tax=Clostridium perfringens TaxID=1502 RepID=UPI001ABAB8B7|nr:ORF6N domain-containing protein [Clostridium perfringens]MBO3419394.1 ORF6N domain-containing protein [Clostridium perfringens]